MSINPINIEPGHLMPAAEEAMNEVARLYPIAYKAVFDLSVALMVAPRAKGMVGSRLAEVVQQASRKVEDASTLIAVSPDAIRTYLRTLGMDQ
jgi:hypothetical protein